tara:strand:+ start:390 stop:1514 length:1125 start_codon:yes stop_codon:yes gene_type:complete
VPGQQYSKNDKNKVLNMAFGGKNNRQAMANAIVEEIDGDSIQAAIEQALGVSASATTGQGAKAAEDTLADTKQTVDSMRQRSLGARKEENKQMDADNEKRVADVGKSWMALLMGDEESSESEITGKRDRPSQGPDPLRLANPALEVSKKQDKKIVDKGAVGLMAKPEVVYESDIELYAQDMLDRIAFGEGANPDGFALQKKYGLPEDAYELVYGHGQYVKPNKLVTEMNLSEIESFQIELINSTKGKIPGTKLGSSALGKYQIIKDSLFGKGGTAANPKPNSWADKLGLTEDSVFNQETQERIGRLALKETGFDNWKKGNKSEADMLQRVADIWASVEGSKADQGTAKTLLSDLMPMLDKIRAFQNPPKLRGDK